MQIDPNQLLALPASEQLQIVELLWDNLGNSCTDIPLPEWVGVEAARRRDEMIADPSFGLDHAQVWDRIDRRNG